MVEVCAFLGLCLSFGHFPFPIFFSPAAGNTKGWRSALMQFSKGTNLTHHHKNGVFKTHHGGLPFSVGAIHYLYFEKSRR